MPPKVRGDRRFRVRRSPAASNVCRIVDLGSPAVHANHEGTVDRATRRRLYNLCDPAQPLEAADPRYAVLDEAGAWVDDIRRRIELSDRPVCELLAAPVGAGVTTEVARLSQRLSEEGIQVVRIGSENAFDMRSPIQEVDILLALLEGVEQHFAVEHSSVFDAVVRPWVRASDRRPGATWREFRDEAEFRRRLQVELQANLSRFIVTVREALTVLDHRARAQGHAGVVAVVDGLEKLFAPTAERARMLDSVERIFTPGAPCLSLPVHVVFTLPLAVLPRLHVPVTVLPLVALHHRDGSPRPQGVEAMRELVARRVPRPDLEALFGRARADDVVTRLIHASGGSPRELVRLLQACIAESSFAWEGFERVLASQTEEFRLAFSHREAGWLARVALTGSLNAASENRDMAEAALLRGAVLPYRNGLLWWDLHPAIREAPEIAATIEQSRFEPLP